MAYQKYLTVHLPDNNDVSVEIEILSTTKKFRVKLNSTQLEEATVDGSGISFSSSSTNADLTKFYNPGKAEAKICDLPEGIIIFWYCMGILTAISEYDTPGVSDFGAVEVCATANYA